MSKQFILAQNTYQMSNWLRAPGSDKDFDGIVIGQRKHFWNNKVYLLITSRSITIEKKTNLYAGATLYLKDKYRWPLFFMLKKMVKDVPVIIYGKETTYTYKNQASKEKLLLKLLNLDKKVNKNS